MGLGAPLLGCNVILSTDDYATGTPHGCGPAEIPIDGACTRVGPSCDPASMTTDPERICVPLLPPQACAPGEIALPGRTSCEPIGACAADPSELVEGPETLIVSSAGCSATASPFCTIEAAVNAAGDDALVVIDAGDYPESLRLDRPLRLRGLCPTTVSIDEVVATATSEIHGLALRQVTVNAAALTLREVWIREGGGLIAHDAFLVIERALIHDTPGGAIVASRGQLQLDAVHIRDIPEDPARLAFGRGLWARGSRIAVSGSLLERTTDAGVLLTDSSGAITTTVIRDIAPSATRTQLGAVDRAVGIAAEPTSGMEPLRIAGTLIDTTRDAGISLRGIDAHIEETVVRRTRSAAKSCAGHSLRAIGTALEPTRVQLRASLLEGSEEAGVHIMGADAELVDSLVRITAASCPAETSAFGDGVAAYAQPVEGTPARLRLERTRVDTNARLGVLAFGDVQVDIASSLLQGNGASGESALLPAAYTPSEGLADHEPRITLASVAQCAHYDGRPFDCPPPQLDRVTPSFLPRSATGEAAPRMIVEGGLTSAGVPLAHGAVAVWGRDQLAAGLGRDGRFALRHVPVDPGVRLFASAPDHASSVSERVTQGMPLVVLPLALVRALSPPWSVPEHGAVLAVAHDATGASPGAVRFQTDPPLGLVYLSGTAVSQAPTPAATAFIPNVAPGALGVLAEPLAAPSCGAVDAATIFPTQITLATFRCPAE